MMPISDAEGYDKGHFTRVYEHLIKPAVMDAGFEPVRADDTSKANFIVVDILKHFLFFLSSIITTIKFRCKYLYIKTNNIPFYQ